MALLVDKHRPHTLDQLTYHPDLTTRLRSLVCSHPPRTYLPTTDHRLRLSCCTAIEYCQDDCLLTCLLFFNRPRLTISLISSYTDPPAPARRPASTLCYMHSTDRVPRASRSTLAFSKRQVTASLSSISLLASITLRSHHLMWGTSTGLSSRSC